MHTRHRQLWYSLLLFFRNNTNGFDLNRNFPGYFEVNTDPIQPETQAVMDWLKQHRFILSANLQGGAIVANYPFDNYVNGKLFYNKTRLVLLISILDI